MPAGAVIECHFSVFIFGWLHMSVMGCAIALPEYTSSNAAVSTEHDETRGDIRILT